MRMTNKIMQSNSLYNINQTKILEDKFNTQLTSQSKITRPSDDPVVAIRALRLRSNVSTITQYNEKNASDADQWLDVTAKSLDTITDVIKNLYNQVQTGVNKDYTASDMQVLLTQIDAYTQEMFATGNQDYAGRYIFTGYRTDTPLTVDENKDLDREYEITESIKISQLDSFSYTDYSVFDNITDIANHLETNIKNGKLDRVRLSYNNLEELKGTITYPGGLAPSLQIVGTTTGLDTAGDAYKAMLKINEENEATEKAGGTTFKSAAIFIPETGELLLDAKTAEKLKDELDQGEEMSISYSKNEWLKDDLNPQHFFDCTDTKTGIRYNEGGDVDTQITYDVGYNQVIQVNTNAYEVFDPAVNRDYADLKEIVRQFTEIETIRADIKKERDSYEESSDEYKDAQKRYDAANKAYTFIRDAVSQRFGNQITRYQNYLDSTNVAITKNGTRSTRLELISTRLDSQQSTFKELQEENEGIDMTEVAVLLTAAKTTYDAALAATSKIMQNNLMNYI